MKRFFIFAALLLTLSSGATQLPDEPPLILPGVEDVVLTPTGMHDDIDRNMTRCICEYVPAMHSLTFTCIGTGNCTEIFLADASGTTVDYACLDAEYDACTTLDVPGTAGTYYIYIRSGSHYGEARIAVE